MADLRGKTLFITGASRGIGLAVGLRAAADGANVVIAAKTAEPHPRLAGTIHTAAEAIEAAGGKALPLIVDIRDEDMVQRAVEQAVATFGGIDILVNNASAISKTDTLATDMKRFDLMHGINTRGTYLVSRACLPYLLQAGNPHVLTMSPPLNVNAKWLAPNVAYSLTKYGMSLCVLGMAAEFVGRCAFNALWPRTYIATDAVRNILGAEAAERARHPAIMGEAAYRIVTRPATEFTGQFCIDETILREEGIVDFSPYQDGDGNGLIQNPFI